MPIYEYRCNSCHRRVSILVRSFSDSSVTCPDCGSIELNRLFSSFSVRKSDQDIYEDILSDKQLVRGLESNDPRALAEWNKKMSRDEKVAPEYEEVVDKLEAGEMPDVDKLKEDYKPQIGEILLSKDGTPGIAYLVDRDVEGIISSGIVRLQSNSDIDIGYLKVALNSRACQLQIKQEGSGALIAHWKPSKISRLLIPRLDAELESQIGERIRQAQAAYREAQELLKKAIKQIHIFIERHSI